MLGKCFSRETLSRLTSFNRDNAVFPTTFIWLQQVPVVRVSAVACLASCTLRWRLRLGGHMPLTPKNPSLADHLRCPRRPSQRWALPTCHRLHRHSSVYFSTPCSLSRYERRLALDLHFVLLTEVDFQDGRGGYKG